jgi:hypothetical protein
VIEIGESSIEILVVIVVLLLSNVTSSVGISTLRKEVHELGVNNCIAVNKPFLSDIHKAKRLAFAKEHLHWTIGVM